MNYDINELTNTIEITIPATAEDAVKALIKEKLIGLEALSQHGNQILEKPPCEVFENMLNDTSNSSNIYRRYKMLIVSLAPGVVPEVELIRMCFASEFLTQEESEQLAVVYGSITQTNKTNEVESKVVRVTFVNQLNQYVYKYVPVRKYKMKNRARDRKV
jgi:hypothetical protein